MFKKLYLDRQFNLDSYALYEGGVLCECSLEHSSEAAAAGNIYKGRVTDVLNGMQAAFVDCGLERHCYLSVTDLLPEGQAYDGDIDIPSALNLHEGDEIMVQILKPPVAKKGAKVTANLSFVGKYIVYLPHTPFIGVSKKIPDEELKRTLLFSAKQHLTEGEGMIVRTAAPYAVIGTKRDELNYFRKLYENIHSRFESAAVGELLYSDSPLYARTLRDNFFTCSDEIHIGSKALYERVKEITEAYPASEKPVLILHDEYRDMMYSEGVTEDVRQNMHPRVELANGAYIVINRTEALTAIDVNTGKYTGSDSLESTVFETNVLAAREIARQLRLRNLGGIFVVDFIDMTDERHKKEIVQELEKALKGDKGKCKVLPMSRFGLVEFTRKRTGHVYAELETRPCPLCAGGGLLRSYECLTAEFRSKVLEILSEGAQTVCVDLNYDTANYILGFRALIENIANLYPHARIYLVSHHTYPPDNMYFRRVELPNFSMPEGTMLLY